MEGGNEGGKEKGRREGGRGGKLPPSKGTHQNLF